MHKNEITTHGQTWTELDLKIKKSAAYIYHELSYQLIGDLPSNFMHAEFLNSNSGIVNEAQAEAFDEIEAEIYTLTAFFFNYEKWLENTEGEISFEDFLRDHQRYFEEEFFDDYYLYEAEIIEEIQHEWVAGGYLMLLKDGDSKVKDIYNKPFKEVW